MQAENISPLPCYRINDRIIVCIEFSSAGLATRIVSRIITYIHADDHSGFRFKIHDYPQQSTPLLSAPIYYFPDTGTARSMVVFDRRSYDRFFIAGTDYYHQPGRDGSRRYEAIWTFRYYSWGGKDTFGFFSF